MFLAIQSQPPRPPRSAEAGHYLSMPKVKEGAIFESYFINPKLLSDLDLGGSDDLKIDLRGQLRSLRPK